MEPTQNSENPIMPPPPVAQMPPPPVAQAPCCSAVPPCPRGGSVGNRKQLYLWGGIGAGVLGLILILVLCLFGRGVRVESDSDVLKWVIERQAQVEAAGNTWLHEKLLQQTRDMAMELSGAESITHRSGVYRAACAFDEVAIVRYLVEVKGMKITPNHLEEAAESSAYEVCRYIIEEELLPANVRQNALDDALYEAVERDAELSEYLVSCGAVIRYDRACRRLERLCGMTPERRLNVYLRNLGREVGPQTDSEMRKELKACARVLVEELHIPVTSRHVERANRSALPELAEYLSSCM